MKRLVLLSATLSLAAAPGAGPALASDAQSPVTPRSIGRMLERYGGRRVVDRLIARRSDRPNADLGMFDLVLDGISSGDPAWLELVPRLETGGHAAAGEALPIAVAFALPKNARGVLRLVARDRRWLAACGYPMIEPTRKEEQAYFAAAVPAVEAVHDPVLQSAKRVCLSELSKARHAP